MVQTPDGKKEKLHSSIDRKEVDFLNEMIGRFNSCRSLEIGCAMGISSMVICEAVSRNSPAAEHIIIDPFQRTDWKGIGLYNLQKSGLQNFVLHEEPSEFVLPKLAQEGKKIDFAFIDGWHTFDHTLIDFFYINRMLVPGGIVVIDDVSMPSVKKVMRMIHTYPAYQVIGSVKTNFSRKPRMIEAMKTMIRPVSKIIGARLSGEIFNASVLQSDKSLQLNASVIAFQKLAEDDRTWNWYKNF